MGAKYEVIYWDYDKCKYISFGYYHWFHKAKKVAKKLLKEWYCVNIVIKR